ncbi:MAG: hypothetical protein ABIF82_03745 [Planctomycetota bacterium]
MKCLNVWHSYLTFMELWRRIILVDFFGLAGHLLARVFRASAQRATGQEKKRGRSMAYRATKRRPSSGTRRGTRYPALLLVATVYVILGWIGTVLAAFGVLIGLVIFFVQKNPFGIMLVLGCVIWGTWIALTQFALAELIRLFVDVSDDAREARRLLDRTLTTLLPEP